ncbi:sensor histidine kinase [Streptomyces sp. NPDC002073]
MGGIGWWGGLLAVATVVYGTLKVADEGRSGLLAGLPVWAFAAQASAAAALLWWRRRPVAVFWFVAAVDLVALTPLGLAVACGSLAYSYRGRPAALAGCAGVAVATHAVAVLANQPAGDGATAASALLSHVLVPMLFGYHTRTQQRLIEHLTARAEKARYEHELLTTRIRSQERARIVRELHDAVANRVGQIVVCAGALEVSTLDTGAEQRAAQIRTVGHQALGELSELLGILRTAGSDVAVPRLLPEDLDQLLDRHRAAGCAVERRGAAGPSLPALPRTVQLTAHRVVEEALANAGRHVGGAPVSVETAWTCTGRRNLRVSVRNGPPPAPVADGPVADRLVADGAAVDVPGPDGPSGPGAPGRGLLGLHERVKLIGGTVVHGPLPDGGFEVTAVLPVAACDLPVPDDRRTTAT